MRPFGLVRMWQSWQRNGWRRQRAGPPGEIGLSGADGAQGLQGNDGLTGLQGAIGPAGPAVISGPTPRIGPNIISIGVPAQALNVDKPAMITLNLASTATLSLLGGINNIGEVRIGPAAAGLATGASGTVVANYRNGLTGSVVLGISMQNDAQGAVSVALPAGWFLCVRQMGGTITIVSAFDQQVG